MDQNSTKKEPTGCKKCWDSFLKILFTDKIIAVDITNTIRCNMVISNFLYY